jgi:hypothetical protein
VRSRVTKHERHEPAPRVAVLIPRAYFPRRSLDRGEACSLPVSSLHTSQHEYVTAAGPNSSPSTKSPSNSIVKNVESDREEDVAVREERSQRSRHVCMAKHCSA